MRVKRGFAGKRRHKRLLKLASGYRGRKGNCFKLAKRAVQKGLQHAYRDRRAKKREFRTLWIARINAAAREKGVSYSKLMLALRKANIDINRKILADLAVRDRAAFDAVLQSAGIS